MRPACLPARRLAWAFFCVLGLSGLAVSGASAQPFQEAVVDIGNVGLTVTNSGYVGRSNVRNATSGPPSFEYPLDSGIEHLFEAGLWVGATRRDGTVSVRTGSITTGGGYSAGGQGFEFYQLDPIQQRSSLLTSPAFSAAAVSQQDYLTSFTDTYSVVPGTTAPTPDQQGQLGIVVRQRSYAWSFPFTEAFVIMEFEVENVSAEPLDSVYVGIWEDMVVRNVVTNTDAGGAFFNKNGRGVIGAPEIGPDGRPVILPVTGSLSDSLFVSYAYNLGGQEESLNTYGATSFLGADWVDPQTGARRFWHPFLAQDYQDDFGFTPLVHTRYWKFGGSGAELSNPTSDAERYRRMRVPLDFEQPVPGNADPRTLREQLAQDGLTAEGNWIGLMTAGPFPVLRPGESLTFTMAWVAALKPEDFQDDAGPGRRADNAESRRLLRLNARFAQQTFAGEDTDYDGVLDAGEDLNGNGLLDRYLIPEPPPAPFVRAETDLGRVTLYWDDNAESAIDPISGTADFEGYRIYRSDPGEDLQGNVLGEVGLVAQYDRAGNDVGDNAGFAAVRLAEPATFPGDSTTYEYAFTVDGLLNGWQYAFAVTAFDRGEPAAGLLPLESGRNASAVRAFPGTRARGRGHRRRPAQRRRRRRLPEPVPPPGGVDLRQRAAPEALLFQPPRPLHHPRVLGGRRGRQRDRARRRHLRRRHRLVRRL